MQIQRIDNLIYYQHGVREGAVGVLEDVAHEAVLHKRTQIMSANARLSFFWTSRNHLKKNPNARPRGAAVGVLGRLSRSFASLRTTARAARGRLHKRTQKISAKPQLFFERSQKRTHRAGDGMAHGVRRQERRHQGENYQTKPNDPTNTGTSQNELAIASYRHNVDNSRR
jgi:hypothetical protein